MMSLLLEQLTENAAVFVYLPTLTLIHAKLKKLSYKSSVGVPIFCCFVLGKRELKSA